MAKKADVTEMNSKFKQRDIELMDFKEHCKTQFDNFGGLIIEQTATINHIDERVDEIYKLLIDHK